MEKIQKRDFLVMEIILLLGVVITLLFFMVSKNGDKIRVSVDGKSIGEWSLSENNRIEIPLDNGEINILVIENGQAHMEEANCPDGLCKKMGRINKTGECIICLPHKVSVEVIGKDNEIDGVVR